MHFSRYRKAPDGWMTFNDLVESVSRNSGYHKKLKFFFSHYSPLYFSNREDMQIKWVFSLTVFALNKCTYLKWFDFIYDSTWFLLAATRSLLIFLNVKFSLALFKYLQF